MNMEKNAEHLLRKESKEERQEKKREDLSLS